MKAALVGLDEAPRAQLGESPRWDGAAWWWVDAAAGTVWTRRPGGPAHVAWHTGERTSLVHPARTGVVVARGTDLWVLDRTAEAPPEAPPQLWLRLDLPTGWLLNDGVADGAGRLWIGTVSPHRRTGSGSLLRVDPDGSVTEAARGFTLTNGMAWDAAGEILFHADSYERCVWAHRVPGGSGVVTDRELFIRFADDDGLPDGLTTDVDGGVWVAMYGAGQVRRYDAAGRLDVVVDVAVPQCTSVEFGGTDLTELLITTAREGYDAERSAAEPLAGRLFHADAGRVGIATHPVHATGEAWT